MDKLIKGNCQKCNRKYIMPLAEIKKHQDDDGKIMCPHCCKERFWETKERCDGCSEKTICLGLFLKNFKNHIKKGRMEGI